MKRILNELASEKFLDSPDERSERTIVSVDLVPIVREEQVVTSGDTVESASVMEERTHGPLHRRLATGNGQAESDRDIVDELLEGIASLDGSVEFWSVSGQGSSNGFAESNIDPRLKL